MADGKNPSSATAQSNDLFDASETIGTNLARVGALMVSWPFYILPTKERDDAIAATTQLFTAVGKLHLDVLRAAARSLGIAARELTSPADAGTPTAPKATTKIPIETTPAAKR